ncbi:MAG: hypothetical protein JNL82_35560 [Myxococcales bacterium]|jgi:hypothetical protein|nr:hypothetical protein [Myxococcales bacterium]
MDSRSPLRIAIESLAEARQALVDDDLPRALDLLDAGLAALGPHYQRAPLLDPGALALALAADLRRKGELDEAYTATERVLEDRLAQYAGRSGAAS